MIKSIVLITLGFIVALIASAYVLYFVGMTMSLAAGAVLGITGVKLAQIFAWIGVGAVVYVFAKMIGTIIEGTSVERVSISGEEIAKILEEKGDD